MAGIEQDAVIEHIALPVITYGSSFTSMFQFDYPYFEPYTCRDWLDLLVFCIPSMPVQYIAVTDAPVATARVAVTDSRGDAAVRCAMREFDAVIVAITENRALPPLPGLDDLLDRAVELKGRPADIEGWSRQLAADVGDLTD